MRSSKKIDYHQGYDLAEDYQAVKKTNRGHIRKLSDFINSPNIDQRVVQAQSLPEIPDDRNYRTCISGNDTKMSLASKVVRIRNQSMTPQPEIRRISNNHPDILSQVAANFKGDPDEVEDLQDTQRE